MKFSVYFDRHRFHKQTYAKIWKTARIIAIATMSIQKLSSSKSYLSSTWDPSVKHGNSESSCSQAVKAKKKKKHLISSVKFFLVSEIFDE